MRPLAPDKQRDSFAPFLARVVVRGMCDDLERKVGLNPSKKTGPPVPPEALHCLTSLFVDYRRGDATGHIAPARIGTDPGLVVVQQPILRVVQLPREAINKEPAAGN